MATNVVTAIPDLHNANRGTKRGLELLEKSLEDYGAGRSILLDKHGTAIAGNKTLEAATAKGFKVRVVDSDGKELIAVRRTDLDLDNGDKRARELAYADNRVGQVGLEWDLPVMQVDQMAGVELKKFWFPEELKALFGEADAPDGFQEVNESLHTDHECPKCGYRWSGGE